jgi:hypothetical protein
MKTAGLILDLYDNPKDLSSIYLTLDEVPEMVKSAQVLSSVELDQLPDTAFALVLMEGESRLRKYACIDGGGTEVNVQYFLLHGHKLPEEAQKTAAANLITACGWYGIEPPPELEKIALGLNGLMTAAMAPSLLKGTHQQISTNMAGASAGGGRVMPLLEQQTLGRMAKSAEASGTALMPSQDAGDLGAAVARGRPGTTNTSAQKSASTGHLVPGHNGEKGDVLEQAFGVAGTQYQKAPQTPVQALRPHVDVTGKQPPKKLETKMASVYAYENVFPLDDYAQVKQASAYFDANLPAMPPSMRHEFAVHMVGRASELGIEFSKEAAAYGSTEFAEDEQLQAALDMRRPFLSKEASAAVDELYAQRAALGPAMYCELLEGIDKVAEIEWRYDRAILDPYASTFGVKVAEAHETWTHANDYVTKKQMESFAVTAALALRDDYGDDFVKDFQKDPWGIFNSLPLPQKVRIARRASDNSATGMHDVQ